MTNAFTNRVIMICLLLGIILDLAALSARHIMTKDYVRVEAAVIRNEDVIKMGLQNNSRHYRIYKITVSYMLDDREYQYQYRTIVRRRLKAGDRVTVFCDRNNPSRVRNPFVSSVLYIALGMMVMAVLALCYTVRHQ